VDVNTKSEQPKAREQPKGQAANRQ